MILWKRRRPKSRVKRIRGELLTSFAHLRSATACAAEGVAEKAAPHVNTALTVVGLRKRPRRRWPWVVGTIAAGTAVGVAGAMLWRRNNSIEREMFREDLRAEELKFEPSGMGTRVDQMAGATAD